MKAHTIAALALALTLPAAAQADSREARTNRPKQRSERVQGSESREGSTWTSDGGTWRRERGDQPDRSGSNVVRTPRNDPNAQSDRNPQPNRNGWNDRSGSSNRAGWNNTPRTHGGWNNTPRVGDYTRYRDYSRSRDYGRSRTQVIVRRGWPIRRGQRYVYVRPYRPWRVFPSLYLSVQPWRSTWVHPAPPRSAVVWQDRATLYGADDWTEFSLNAGTRGARIGFVVDGGDVQIDWAEVVYSNGETEVVDFDSQLVEPGEYELLDFGGTRTVDHVRLVARAQGDESTISLLMDR